MIDERVATRKAELDALRPLSRDGLTALVIGTGITIGGKPLGDHLEAVGHKDALDYIRSFARQDQPVRETDIRQIHALVIGRIDPAEAGRYASHQRLISGTTFLPPTPAQVVPLMGDLGRWLGQAAATAETAIAAHDGWCRSTCSPTATAASPGC